MWPFFSSFVSRTAHKFSMNGAVTTEARTLYMPYTTDRLQATRARSLSCDYVRRQEHTNIAESPQWVVCERVRYTFAKACEKNSVNDEFSRQLMTCLRTRRKRIKLAPQQSRHSGSSARWTHRLQRYTPTPSPHRLGLCTRSLQQTAYELRAGVSLKFFGPPASWHSPLFCILSCGGHLSSSSSKYVCALS